MSAPIEIEGDWQTIAAEAERYKDHKMRLTVLPDSDAASSAQDRRPIAEVLAEMASRVPTEEMSKIPADFSDQLDHYIYGSPRR